MLISKVSIALLLLAASAFGQCSQWMYNPQTRQQDCIAPLPGNRAATCAKVTVASTNAAFIVAGTTADITLFTLPQYGKITGVTVKHSAQFSDGAGAMTDVSVSVGDSSSTTAYTTALSIGEVTPVADTTFQDTNLHKSTTMASAGRAVLARFTATARNFGDGATTFLTGGSVDIWACYLRLQ